MKETRICAYCGGDKDVRYNSKAKLLLCAKHSRQFWLYGRFYVRTNKDKNEMREEGTLLYITLYKKQVAGEDSEVTAETVTDVGMKEIVSQYRWWMTWNGYVCAHDNKSKKKVYLHHLVLPKKEGFVIDHKNENKLDNRLVNLRHATYSENVHNQKSHKGVYPRNGKWEARIKKNGKIYILGRFVSHDEAMKVRLEAEKRFYGEFAPNR